MSENSDGNSLGVNNMKLLSLSSQLNVTSVPLFPAILVHVIDSQGIFVAECAHKATLFLSEFPFPSLT